MSKQTTGMKSLLFLSTILVSQLPALAQSTVHGNDSIKDRQSVDLNEVKVFGKSAARKLEEGVFAVNALEIAPDINRMVTINDLVNRTAGVKVRREGGVGSDFDLTINGMSGNSIRYFIDGVPLESKGSGVSLENIPLNIVERVELYKGVVPSHLGADALGGAVNIITKKKRQNFLDASYGIGSFHTHTADLTGQWFIPRTAIALRPTVGVNYSKNDYKMKGVEIWDEDEERYILTDRRRFHDDYLSIFGQLEAGVNNVGWADMFFLGYPTTLSTKRSRQEPCRTKCMVRRNVIPTHWLSLPYTQNDGVISPPESTYPTPLIIARLSTRHTANIPGTVHGSHRQATR